MPRARTASAWPAPSAPSRAPLAPSGLPIAMPPVVAPTPCLPMAGTKLHQGAPRKRRTCWRCKNDFTHALSR
eukprot:8105570-Pyramimonas_sp.AAC.1